MASFLSPDLWHMSLLLSLILTTCELLLSKAYCQGRATIYHRLSLNSHLAGHILLSFSI